MIQYWTFLIANTVFPRRRLTIHWFSYIEAGFEITVLSRRKDKVTDSV